jgi:hypothetical protein
MILANLPGRNKPAVDDTSAVGERLRENIPHHPIEAPLLIAEGQTDELVLPLTQERFVKQRCDAGQRLEYPTYAARDHLSVVGPDSPLNADLVRWTQLAGKPQNPGCRTIPVDH